MLLQCFEYYGFDNTVKDQVAVYSEWFTTVPMGVRYFIRADRAAWAWCCSGQLIRRPAHDQIQ